MHYTYPIHVFIIRASENEAKNKHNNALCKCIVKGYRDEHHNNLSDFLNYVRFF